MAGGAVGVGDDGEGGIGEFHGYRSSLAKGGKASCIPIQLGVHLPVSRHQSSHGGWHGGKKFRRVRGGTGVHLVKFYVDGVGRLGCS